MRRRIRDLFIMVLTIVVVFGLTQYWAYIDHVPTTPMPTLPTPTETTYQNCDAVRLAGVAPLHPDDPGYTIKLDRDSDGIACE